MIKFSQSKSIAIGIVILVMVSITGCGIVPIDIRYIPSGINKSVITAQTKVNLHIKDAREKKVFFRTVLGDNGDNGKNGVLKLTRTPAEVFNEGFTEALQAAGCQVRKDADIVYEVGIQRFLAIDMQKSPHFLDSDIVLEVLVKHSEKVLATKTIFERDTEKQAFGQVWQDTVPPLLSRSLSQAIEKAVWEPSIIAAIEQANGFNTTAVDVSTRLKSTAANSSPIFQKSKPASYTSLNTTYDKNRASPFKAHYVRGLGPPEVLIKNQSHKTITINLTGADEYSISLPPRESTKKTITAGNYSYHASASGVQSCSGIETFNKDHRYTWTFMVVSYPSMSNITIPGKW